jgi:co-chaperonin GroES (HSP10)
MSDEEREQLKKHQAEQLEKDQQALQQEQKKEQEKKQVTLTELLATTLQPQEDRIIVWRDKAERFTEGGLLKPEEALQNERPVRGTVIAVGPGKDSENLTQEILCEILRQTEIKNGGAGVRHPSMLDVFISQIKTSTANYKPGERIMFGRFAGTPIDDPETGEELLIMRPHDIFVKL